MAFIEEETFIIGEFGLAENHFNHFKLPMEALTMSLEHSHCLFGKL